MFIKLCLGALAFNDCVVGGTKRLVLFSSPLEQSSEKALKGHLWMNLRGRVTVGAVGASKGCV